MAATLVNVALSEMRVAHATYYGEVNERNPVIVAVGKELKEFCKYVEKSKEPDYKREKNEASSRASNWLFDIWNKYELRLPKEFFYQKLIEIGDFLSLAGAHVIAQHQCYEHFLLTCHKVPLSEAGNDTDTLKAAYFRNGMSGEHTVVTCQALLGSFVCRFQITQKADPDLVRADSVAACIATLNGLRTFMQCIQPYESFYWMLYNCTIVMYQMGRKLMTSNQSAKAIEFLLWAAMCMEASVPLLAVEYLTWRVTLYTAVCLAQYDSGKGQQAETFARRSLTKLQELSELEAMSGSGDSEITRLIFQQATVKMAAMVFKRTVFESRRRPKGLLRPKMRGNLKEAAQLVWPRTASEKLLSDMFVGSAAQFLAIVEALSDGHRRIFQPQSPAGDSETEILDVYAELFFSGREIIAGGGGAKNHSASNTDHSLMAGMRSDKSLIQLAAAGEDGVTLVSVIRFIKLAFCYEQWESFSSLLDSTLLYIKKSETDSDSEGGAENKAPELCLALLLVMERVIKSRSKRAHTSTSASAINVPEDQKNGAEKMHSTLHVGQAGDDLINLAETVYYCINNPSLFSPSGKDGEILIDRDMILDACRILWNRCKAVLNKLQNSSNPDKNPVSQKWIHILQIIHGSFVWCGISSVDPATLAEVSLRLALLLESAPSVDGDVAQEEAGTRPARSQLSMTSAASRHQTRSDRLTSAREVLADAIKSLCTGMTMRMSFDGSDVSDTMWMRDSPGSITQEEALIRDLHVELLDTHHRISLKLIQLNLQQSKSVIGVTSRTSVATSRSQKRPADTGKKQLKEMVGGNLLSDALYHVQLANVDHEQNSNAAATSLKKAASLLRQAEEEEEKLYYLSHDDGDADSGENHVVPPSPILLARSDSTVIFKPAPFHCEYATVAWYRLFGRTAAGPNVKVRLNDYFLEGTGVELPAGKECVFRVDGLRSNERYLFAVAAYGADGSLIGGSIGATSEVIPAHHPMSILNAWCIVAETSHKLGIRSVAKQAAAVLWHRFVAPPPERDTNSWTTSIESDFKLTHHKLEMDAVKANSQILLRHVVGSMFISVDAAIHEGGLFWNKFCDNGPLLPSQILRLKECEKMLVAIDLAGYLNDSPFLLQAVTQCYHLLVPFIQSNIYSKPVVQVLAKCHVVLQVVCQVSRGQRSPMVNDSIHHMIAVITFYLAKVFRTWGMSEPCLSIIDAGKRLLNQGEQPVAPQRNVDSSEKPGTTPRSKKRGKEPATAPQSKKRGKEPVTAPQSKKRGIKPVSLVNPNMSQELNALEEHLAELTREKHMADELTGGEEPSTVLSYIMTAKPMLAYKEISKFRRRSRYLEYFVHVMHKALHGDLIDPALEWSQEVLLWLRRRNEGLSVNHTLMSVENGAVVVKGNDPPKYAAALVTYGQDAKDAKSKKKKPQRRRSRLAVKAIGTEQEEQERKALGILEKHFAEAYKNSVKRIKLRKLTLDEMPWRAEFNHVLALMHFDIFLNKVEQRLQLIEGNVHKSRDPTLINQKAWSLDGCGSMVVQPSTIIAKPFNVKGNIAIEADDDDPGQALLVSAKQAINTLFEMDADAGMQAQISPEEDSVRETDSPRTQRTNSPLSVISTQTLDPSVAAIQNNVIYETLKVCMLSFRRGLVLAHRGKHWNLLQNITSSLLDCVAGVLEKSVNVLHPVISHDDFRHVVWLPMSLASDFLLDMLIDMQEGQDGTWSVKSYVGDVKDEKGGTNLTFDVKLDDGHLVDIPRIKSILLQTIQILHFEGRWETLVDICLRFSALTHDRYTETLSPILIHAQHKIARRVREYGGENVAHIAVDPNGERVSLNNRNYITAELRVQNQNALKSPEISIGGYIDPAAHDVYDGGRRAMALSRVPFDVTASLANFHDAIRKSQYMSRALMHSRRLLGLYLASQHNKKESRPRQLSAHGSKHEHQGSSVGFVDVQSKNQQPFPPDLLHTDFSEPGDVEASPFAHLPTVIESYVKTIELLTSHGEKDLVAQANHELGNLHLHMGNAKAANRAWSKALDQIFRVTKSLKQWPKLFENSEDIPQAMLKRLGVWGCLLAIVLTCKIGEFTTHDVQIKTDCALLAGELVCAIFRVSLPHPTSNAGYKSYEIFPQHILDTNSKPRKFMPGATSIFPNIDLFSDPYRCEARQLMSSLHWLSETLVQMHFNLKALPPLCIYQYLATFVCKDIQRSVQCRCMKITATINMRAFDAAVNDLAVLLFGSKLPHPTDHIYREAESVVPNIVFKTSQSIESLDNLRAMETIASKRLSAGLSQLYGPQLTCEITLQQSRLLIEIAESIACVPQRPSMQDLISVATDTTTDETTPLPQDSPGKGPQSTMSYVSDDVRSTISAMSTTSTSRQARKLFSKRESPVTLPLLKGMLLAVSESLLVAMLAPLKIGRMKLSAAELWVAVQCYLTLSQMEVQRQHSTIAASQILKALELMQSSSVFNDVNPKRPRKIRSALKNRGANIDPGPDEADIEESYLDITEHTYRTRLNPRLWLTLRLHLCNALQTQISGLGKVKNALAGDGPDVSPETTQLYCAEGLVEAEACNDLEMQAAFLLQGSLVNGLSNEETLKMLEDAVNTLDELPQLSDEGTTSLVRATVAIADLHLQCGEWSSSHAIHEFHNAHAIMLLHSMQHGETIRHSRVYTSTIDSPCQNIYREDILVHAHVKLRIGRASYFTLNDTSAVEDWQSTVEVLRQAKALCEASAERDQRLTAEINLELAKASRALYFMNGCPLSSAETAFQLAIKSSHVSDPTVGRYGHLELAMLGISLNTEEPQQDEIERSGLKDITQIAKSLHTAFAVAEAMRNRSLLPGNATVTSLAFTDENKGKLPNFVLLDLASGHKEIPEAVTIEDATVDPVVLAVQMESGEFSWIHVLHYRVLLLRKFSSVRISDNQRAPTVASDDSDDDDFYPGEAKQSDQGSQATKTPLFSNHIATRVDALHGYLQEHLSAYADTCNLRPFDSKASQLLVQWYRVRHKFALLWCKTDSGHCGKLLISPSDVTRLLVQIKALLQKVEIHFGQTMAPPPKTRSRNVRQRKQSTQSVNMSQIPTQLEDDVKQTLTNASLLMSPDQDVITVLPFQVSVAAIEHMVDLFTIGCCFSRTDPLYEWLSNLLIMSSEQ